MNQPVTSTVMRYLTIGVGIFVGALGVYVVPLQVGAWTEGLGMTGTQSGLAGMLEIAAMSLTAIVVSPRLQAPRPSTVALGGAVIVALAQLLTAFAENFTLILLLRVGTGIGCGLVFGVICSVVSTSNQPDRLFASGQAIMNFLFMLLFFFLPLSMHYGQHTGLFVALAAIVVLTLPLYRWLPDGDTVILTSALPTARVAKYLIGMHILAAVLLNIGLGALWGFVERIGNNLALTSEDIGVVLSAATLAMIGGSLLAAWLDTRIGRIIPVVTSACCCGISSWIISNTQSSVVFSIGLMAYGVAYMIVTPYVIAGISSVLDSSGRLASAMGGVTFLSYSVGVGIAGLIVDWMSVGGIGWLALISCGGSAILFLVIGTRLKAVGGSLH